MSKQSLSVTPYYTGITSCVLLITGSSGQHLSNSKTMIEHIKRQTVC